MSLLPRLQLRDFFLLFVCAAVALVIGSLEAAVETAVVIGLAQQLFKLISWQPEPGATAEIRFARHFAIIWRAAFLVIMPLALCFNMLLSKGLIVLPERAAILLIEPLSEGVLQLCTCVAICSSLAKYSWAIPPRYSRCLCRFVFWLLGILLVTSMLIEVTLIDFLIHRAVEGVEKSQRPGFQRPGLYIQLSEHNYDATWFGLAAVVCVIAAGLIVSERSKSVGSFVGRVKRAALLLGVLVIPAVYCAWYYVIEFHRISPDIAGAGLALEAFDAVAGSIIAIILVTAGAYRCASTVTQQAVILPIAAKAPSTAFHISSAVLILFFGYACSIVILTSGSMAYAPMAGRATVFHYLSMLVYPTTVLQLAIAIAIFQLCWFRWKSRSTTTNEVIFGLSNSAFNEAWLSLAAILIVGIPTLRAFAFTLWLGPFPLTQLYGF